MQPFHGTTILALRHRGLTVMAGDGQVSLGPTVVKTQARKVRRLYRDSILAGFAGATADAFTLFERFERQLDQHQGNLRRAAVELAKDWRTDRLLRRLEALLLVADRETILMLSGSGDVIEPDEHYHHELGRTLLRRLATTPEAQAAARRAARRTLELAEELQRLALATAGIHHAPGC